MLLAWSWCIAARRQLIKHSLGLIGARDDEIMAAKALDHFLKCELLLCLLAAPGLDFDSEKEPTEENPLDIRRTLEAAAHDPFRV